MKITADNSETQNCAHCGESCADEAVSNGDGAFCCAGCQGVYEILHANGLQAFYQVTEEAGRRQETLDEAAFAWLDIAGLAARFIRYQDAERTHVVFELPTIHCASCLWLLEQLPRLQPGVHSCTVDFSRRTATIVFARKTLSLRQLAETLATIGYPPHVREDRTESASAGRQLLYRIGVAGFAFGNVMLLSFPEYLGLGAAAGAGQVGRAMSYLLLVFSLPVMFYSGGVFLRAAWYGMKARRVTIDVPIALGMVALFGRSVYEILSGTGAGYLDSLAGLVFFLLIGRWFQRYTFARLNFDRDYRDYFPIAAHRLNADNTNSPVATEELVVGDRVLIRPGQLIPADGVLLTTGVGEVDYSFVTGEAEPQTITKGQAVFAGGRALVNSLEVVITKAAAQSYLLQLWQENKGGKQVASVGPAEALTRWFTLLVLGLAVGSFAFWSFSDLGRAWQAATAVLIIACPCALALAAPFLYGSLQRLLAQRGFYLRGPAVAEQMRHISTLIFDKTGTLSEGKRTAGWQLLDPAAHPFLSTFRGMASQSDHPRSRALFAALEEVEARAVTGITEKVGEGIELQQEGRIFRIGSATYCGLRGDRAGTFASVDGAVVLLLYSGEEELRPGVGDLLLDLEQRFTTYLLSGDHPPETSLWRRYFKKTRLGFRQSPFAKQQKVRALQEKGEIVLMLGDGLNDSGALTTANVGLAVSEDEARFSPACDGIVAAQQLPNLGTVLSVARRSVWVLRLAYLLAFLYNIIGLSYAVTGTLSPVIAAILMPLSSLSVILLSVLGAALIFRRAGWREIPLPLTNLAPAGRAAKLAVKSSVAPSATGSKARAVSWST